MKPKYLLELYLTALLDAVVSNNPVYAKFICLKNNSLGESLYKEISITPDIAITELTKYITAAKKIINQPCLSYIVLAIAKQKNKWDEAISDENNFYALENDEYYNQFYTSIPNASEFDDLDDLYLGYLNVFV
jgi:hypothetical protein